MPKMWKQRIPREDREYKNTKMSSLRGNSGYSS